MTYKKHEKVINLICWFLGNLTTFTITLYWLIEGNKLAEIYVIFVVHFRFCISLILFHINTANKLRKNGYNINPRVNFFIDFCLGIILVTCDHWWLGVIYIIAGLFQKEVYMW